MKEDKPNPILEETLDTYFPKKSKDRAKALVLFATAEVLKLLWKDAFWSRSYFLATTGQVTLDVLKKYVDNQGKK